MRGKYYLLALSLSCVGLSNTAYAKPETIESLTHACVEAGSTAAQIECFKSTINGLNQRMDSVYNKGHSYLEKRVEESKGSDKQFDAQKQLSFLEKSQKAWLEYRDNYCDFYEYSEGSIAPVRASICMVSVTVERIQELKHM